MPLLERALTIREAALGGKHPEVALSLELLASLYLREGRYVLARPLYDRALAIREAVLGESHPAVAESLRSLALFHLAQQQVAEAMPLFERAFRISEEHLRREVFGFSEAGLEDFLRLLRSEEEEHLYALASAHPGNRRVQRMALVTALLRKGRSAEEIADTSRIIHSSLSPADGEAFERLRALRTQLAALSLSGPASLSPAEYRQRLKALAAEGDTLEEDLARRSAPLRTLTALPPPEELVSRVAAALPHDGVLIEFIAYSKSPLVPKPGISDAQSSGETHYLALMLFANGRTKALELGPAAPIDRAAVRLHDLLADKAASYRPAAQALHALLFRPLMPLLGKARRLFLSTDAQLTLVPMAALHDGSHFLADVFDMTYLVSGKDLLPRPGEVAPAQSVVVMADPEFDVQPHEPSRIAREESTESVRSPVVERFFSTRFVAEPDSPWPSLPGTRQEAEAIKRLLPQAQLLLGRAATKEALLALSAPGVLHVATHGKFFEDSVTPVGRRLPEHEGVGQSAGPLLRSVLVLAGAQAPVEQPGAYRREDSFVTALELAGLNLWGTQLVVLSACDTGRGDVKLGQGVYGLRRALVVAGAQTVVTSLWRVKDDTTLHLMEGYYRNLMAGQGRITALRKAMQALRRKHPHPYFWAPFVAIGQDAPLKGLMPHTEVQLMHSN